MTGSMKDGRIVLDGTPDPDIRREFTAGVHWLGGCLVVKEVTPNIHSHLNAYLIRGSERSLFVDTGHPKDWVNVRRHLLEILDGRPLDIIFPTHQEFPHAGNTASLLDMFPEAIAVGDVRDYHVYWPQHRGRFVSAAEGDRFDLGDREVVLLPAVIHDLPSTLWAYDTTARVMFVSDGFSYSHQHEAGECDLLSTELGHDPSPRDIAFVNEAALHWTKFVDCRPLFDEITAMFGEYPADFIAPAHGNVIADPEKVVPLMRAFVGRVKSGVA